MKKQLYISTSPFGDEDPSIFETLKSIDIFWNRNLLERKLSTNELIKNAGDCDAIIAGTENLLPLIEKNKKLKIIARVGIGLDGVPLHECLKREIKVCWTPDAVTSAVAELTIGLMLNSTRHINFLDRKLRKKQWSRISGRGIKESTIGLIGFGRIGSLVSNLLSSFKPKEILVYDLKNKSEEIKKLKSKGVRINLANFEEIITKSHILSIHTPLWEKTYKLIGKNELRKMPPDSFLINVSRGGIIDEKALEYALNKKIISGAAIDTFEKEPYYGPLIELENCIIGKVSVHFHLGSKFVLPVRNYHTH